MRAGGHHTKSLRSRLVLRSPNAFAIPSDTKQRCRTSVSIGRTRDPRPQVFPARILFRARHRIPLVGLSNTSGRTIMWMDCLQRSPNQKDCRFDLLTQFQDPLRVLLWPFAHQGLSRWPRAGFVGKSFWEGMQIQCWKVCQSLCIWVFLMFLAS